MPVVQAPFLFVPPVQVPPPGHSVFVSQAAFLFAPAAHLPVLQSDKPLLVSIAVHGAVARPKQSVRHARLKSRAVHLRIASQRPLWHAALLESCSQIS